MHRSLVGAVVALLAPLLLSGAGAASFRVNSEPSAAAGLAAGALLLGVLARRWG